jgi:hypothetical protein
MPWEICEEPHRQAVYGLKPQGGQADHREQDGKEPVDRLYQYVRRLTTLAFLIMAVSPALSHQPSKLKALKALFSAALATHAIKNRRR